MVRLTATVLFASLAVAAAGKWRQSPCVEPADQDGNTCSDYASLEGETTCEELMSLIDGATFNGETLHCQCACPEWYEPIPDTAETCNEWSTNSRCPETYDKETFDYHPLGDDDEEACLKLCSNMPGPVCCLFRGDGLCYSHRITSSMKVEPRTGTRASICNVGCAAKFDVTLYDDGEDGWSGYELSLVTAETNSQLSAPITHKQSDVYKSTHKVCVRQETPCYAVSLVKPNGVEVPDQAAQIRFEISFDGALVASGNASSLPAFGLDGRGCPSRLFKRLGRYSLKQFEKVADEALDAAKAYRNIGRKADKLGLFVRPVKKMGAVWPSDASWVPTTTTDPFNIQSTTTTTTTTVGSDYSALVTGGGSCRDAGHCVITDIDTCEQEATKWGLSDTAADEVARTAKPPGCVVLGGGSLQFNTEIAGNQNAASSSSTLVCRLCTTTSTTSTTTSSTTSTTTTSALTTEAPVRTAAATTEAQGRIITTESPYEVIQEGRCWQYGLCRVATSEDCDKAASSLGTTRSGDIDKLARPGGCLEFADGRFKFNVNLDSDVESQVGEAMVVCKACTDFKAPAPQFERVVTTDAPTRADVSTEADRKITTEALATRKVTKPATTNRYVEYVTKPAGTERCRPDYCALDSSDACRDAAVFTGQSDVTPGTEARPLKAAGCYVSATGVLKFNSQFILDDGTPNLSVGRSTETHLCAVCAPAPSPARVSTDAPTRKATTDAVVRTEADTTLADRSSTAPPRNYYYYSTEARDTGAAYEVVIETERPAYYGVDPVTTTRGRGTTTGGRTTTLGRETTGRTTTGRVTTTRDGGGRETTTNGRATTSDGRATTTGGRGTTTDGRVTTSFARAETTTVVRTTTAAPRPPA